LIPKFQGIGCKGLKFGGLRGLGLRGLEFESLVSDPFISDLRVGLGGSGPEMFLGFAYQRLIHDPTLFIGLFGI
jgi:hypothetical protein